MHDGFATTVDAVEERAGFRVESGRTGNGWLQHASELGRGLSGHGSVALPAAGLRDHAARFRVDCQATAALHCLPYACEIMAHALELIVRPRQRCIACSRLARSCR